MASSLTNSLELWKLLISTDASREARQKALSALPPTSSLTFEADPSVTSADVDNLETGKSLLLLASSPVAKTMAGTHHVGVSVVSCEEFCMGVFNWKEVKARRDPVVRACGLPIKGKNACTNGTHRKQGIAFEGRRLLISTPTISKSTTPAFFSAPYLKIESLPMEAVEPLCELNAPISIWRTFFADTQVLVPDIWALHRPLEKPPLSVTTDFDPEVLQKVAHRANALAHPPSPQVSPSSYEIVDEPPVEETKENLVDHVDDSNEGDLLPKRPDKAGDYKLFIDHYHDALDEQVETPSNVNMGHYSREVDEVYSDLKTAEQLMTGEGLDDVDDDSLAVASLVSQRPGPPSCGDPSLQPQPRLATTSDLNMGSDTVALLLRQILQAQEDMANRLSALEADNRALRVKVSKGNSLAQQAFRSGAAKDIRIAQIEANCKNLITKAEETLLRAIPSFDARGFQKLREDVSALMNGSDATDDRILSLEQDIRTDDGLLMTLIKEVRAQAAAGATGSFTAGGYTMSSEDCVLSMLTNLPGKNNYVTFANMKILFALCGDSVTSLTDNMLLHKATKGADFEDTFSARVNTAFAVAMPSVFARKSTTGDSLKLIWQSGFKSYAAFAGGKKVGGRTMVERQLRKAKDMVAANIRRRMPVKDFPMQYSVAMDMLDRSFLSAFDMMDAITKFYFMMAETGLSEAAAWENTQEFIIRVFEELEMVSNEAGEEDIDAGYVWASMCITNKVDEFQHYRWGEHPSICAMLMFSVLERLGDHGIKSDEAITSALEHSLEELASKQREDHEKAANALNELKQLRDTVKGLKKDKA